MLSFRQTALTLICLTSLLCTDAGAKKPAAPRHRTAVTNDDPDVVVYGQRDDVATFAHQAAEAENISETWAMQHLSQARYLPAVAKLIMPAPAGSAKNWQAYRARFIDAQRIRDGLRFWQANEAALSEAEQRWGVPPDIVTAIVGVESVYGKFTGNFRVIDALATLSFDFPKGRTDRTAFYRDELQAFLAWCAAEHRDPLSVKGSFAGAIGLPQFMPGSIRKYAVDFDGDGRIDLDRSGADVVGSVANYFARFGWERGMPTHYSVAPPVDTTARAALLSTDIQPRFTAAQMTEAGAVLDDQARAHQGLLALVELQNGTQASSYVAGTRNFYVVTRYNWSSYYAMAVIELARELRQMRPPAPQASASAPRLQ
jgi:membrane-bound lytic murein transglycosylase B